MSTGVTPILEYCDCPRCGYDMRGAVVQWTTQCPLEGTCTECGLHFRWGRVLDQGRRGPRWCIESANWRRLPFACYSTLMRLCWPPHFWRHVRMEQPIRRHRLLLVPILLFVLLYVYLIIGVGMDVTRASSQVQATGVTLKHPPVAAGIRAAALPFSDETNVAVFPQNVRLVATTDAHRFTKRRTERIRRILPTLRAAVRSGRFNKPWDALSTRHAVSTTVFAIHICVVALLAPIGFIALPQTLRRARVRFNHLIRVTAYGLPILFIPLAWLMEPFVPHWMTRPLGHVADDYLMFGLSMALLIAWWVLAARHYLRLPHASGIGLAVIALPYLMFLFVVSFVDYLLI